MGQSGLVEKTQAILIGRRRISESSLLVTWCTLEHGLLRTRARGALRQRAALAGRLDLFVSAEISMLRPSRGEVWTLGEVVWSNPRPELRKDYGKVMLASYLVRLLQAMVEPLAAIATLHDLLGKALDYLEGHAPSLTLVERFEWRLACELGLADEGTGASGQGLRLLLPQLPAVLLTERQMLLEYLRRR